jgi:hypothetical protein
MLCALFLAHPLKRIDATGAMLAVLSSARKHPLRCMYAETRKRFIPLRTGFAPARSMRTLDVRTAAIPQYVASSGFHAVRPCFAHGYAPEYPCLRKPHVVRCMHSLVIR